MVRPNSDGLLKSGHHELVCSQYKLRALGLIFLDTSETCSKSSSNDALDTMPCLSMIHGGLARYLASADLTAPLVRCLEAGSLI